MADKKEEDVLLKHNYDGIRELDNDLPPWWLYLFYITIIWGILYLIHYHVLKTGDSSHVEYLKEMNPGYEEPVTASFEFDLEIGYRSPFYKSGTEMTPLKRFETGAEPGSGEQATAEVESSLPEETFDDIAVLLDDASLTAGKSVFETHCVTCHGKLGEGGIGPNLTDNYFIHGHSMANKVAVIVRGVPAKGMIPWRGILKETEIQQVASYIQTLEGTDPPNGKAPQGEQVALEGE